MRVIRDDNIDTCVVFSPLMEAPWYTDFIIPLYFVNKTETVTVEIFGGNIGCSSGDEAMFYIMPISNWDDSNSLFERRETCRFHESTSVVGTCAQRCAYRCKYSVESLALRVIRIPRDKPQTGWKICEMSNLLYENPLCRSGPSGSSDGGNPIDNRACWIAAGRHLPTRIEFFVGNFLYG
ncbi:hypothetical protein LSH36_1335g00037 [Paralvinella palmiformis]|uniref:Uncharacterized protein n=1 Tax=Paralvinella palmiformis TaxID=53620 RepID=A0AAD9IUF5_9ANNE|nr:hypothetical protein LSH36_1335g00037 [Paralvinella palmiformis]